MIGDRMKHSLSKLFKTRKPYDEVRNEAYFLDAIRDSVEHYYVENECYRKICEDSNFTSREIHNIGDLYKIPVIPTLYFKRNPMETSQKKLIEVTSSGTSGKVSKIGFRWRELRLLAHMAIRLGRVHGLFSMKPTHSILLGYQPTKKNQTVISKTASLSTLYAFSISRTYALTWSNGEYQLDLERLIHQLEKYQDGIWPVRVIGFPSYTYFLLHKMKQENRKCHLPSGSKVLLGGGWKQFAGEEVDKETLTQLVEEVLGVKKENIHEFYSAAEHPILYCTCKNHRFHVPVYGKVLIRDVSTLKPMPKGEVGLVNLITPLQASIPLTSVMTDDLGILQDGKQCGCGIETDYLEILGRVGVNDIKTCSAGAREYLKGYEV